MTLNGVAVAPWPWYPHHLNPIFLLNTRVWIYLKIQQLFHWMYRYVPAWSVGKTFIKWLCFLSAFFGFMPAWVFFASDVSMASLTWLTAASSSQVIPLTGQEWHATGQLVGVHLLLIEFVNVIWPLHIMQPAPLLCKAPLAAHISLDI